MLGYCLGQGILAIIFDMQLVLGVDAGGTSSRAVLFTLEGEPVRRGSAGGANPVTLGMDAASANLAEAVRAALSGVSPSQVRAAVVGLAGNPALCASLSDRVLRAALPSAFPSGTNDTTPSALRVRTVGDVVTAFASGTAAASGAVLISGTGAAAAKISDHVPVATADGYGWQLGDEGSAFWIGRAAARTAIRALATPDQPAGLLTSLVVCHLLQEADGGGDPVARLAAAVHARHPLALAELAPLVSRAARAGDPAAVSIAGEAARRLARTVSAVHEPGLPIVLFGGVLTTEGPVREAVRDLLDGAGTVTVAGDPAGAAAWLAARAFLDARESRARHARFTAAPPHVGLAVIETESG
ncbi:ATPase [Nonomuraea aridisoli]|uniref:ATPase n=2 Tax=Nonomuraea aridisoli TaxID=2070368 RepID=A0A2W2EMY8_9ACTN|nr:ATPase [Nonomuraea aridisoli]